MNERLCHLLYALGISSNYNGFYCICDAVEIAVNNPQALTSVTKHIYLQIAKQRSTSWKAVERNIRSCVDIFWSSEPGKLQQLTGCSVHNKLTSAQFIAILRHYLTSCPFYAWSSESGATPLKNSIFPDIGAFLCCPYNLGLFSSHWGIRERRFYGVVFNFI